MANITHEDNANPNPNPNPNPALPEEMIYEILSRLPAKSLSEFQFVCKSWKSLISCPEFIKTHLSKLTNDPAFAHQCLLLFTWPSVEQANIPFSSCSVNALLDDETVPETVGTYHPGDDRIYVVGYCNGLFCLTSHVRSSEEIFLWNPFTGKSRRFPKHEHEHRAHGFCYDESNDDYKVFAISGPVNEYKQNVSVYSSKSGCWRIIGDHYFGRIYGLGCFANGAMHSLVARKNMQFNNEESKIIVSIDIKTETYREVSLPPEGEGAPWTTLGTFDENLSVLYDYETRADFWVKSGAEESWTKLFTIPFIIGLPCEFWIKPLCISIGGDIMLLSGSAIVLYNPKSNTFKKLLDMSDNEFDVGYGYTYVENLVSPPN